MLESIFGFIKGSIVLLSLGFVIVGLIGWLIWKIKRKNYVGRAGWQLSTLARFVGRFVISLVLIFAVPELFGPRDYLLYSDTHIPASKALGKSAVFGWKQDSWFPGNVKPVFVSNNYKTELKAPPQLVDRYAKAYPWQQVLPWYQQYIFALMLIGVLGYKITRRMAGVSLWRAACREPSIDRYEAFVAKHNNAPKTGKLLLRERRKADAYIDSYYQAINDFIGIRQRRLADMGARSLAHTLFSTLLERAVTERELEIGVTVEHHLDHDRIAQARQLYAQRLLEGAVKAKKMDELPDNFAEMIEAGLKQGLQHQMDQNSYPDVFSVTQGVSRTGLTLALRAKTMPFGLLYSTDSGRYCYLNSDELVELRFLWRGQEVGEPLKVVTKLQDDKDTSNSPFTATSEKFYAHQASLMSHQAIGQMFALKAVDGTDLRQLSQVNAAEALGDRINKQQQTLLEELMTEIKGNISSDLRGELIDHFYQRHEAEIAELLVNQTNFADHGQLIEIMVKGLDAVVSIDMSDMSGLLESVNVGIGVPGSE